MNVGSLFTGIGGFDLGLERAGMRVVWQCEQNEYRRRVLARHWPGVPCYPDVRALVADSERFSVNEQHNASVQRGRPGDSEQTRLGGGGCGRGDVVPMPVPYVDLICGGFPCQDLSLAGKGAGIDGARSGLWSEFARIVGELRPRYVVVENVPALAHRGLGRVLGDLAALGYDAEWDCLSASAFGAPHRRDRIWLVAYPHGERGNGSGSFDEGREELTDGGCGDFAHPDSNGGRCEAGAQRHGREEQPGEQASLGHDADGLHPALADTECAGLEGHRPGPLRTGPTARSDQGLPDPNGQPQDGLAIAWPERGHWSVEPDVGRVAHGIPSRVDRLSALGDALVPQIAEWIGRRLMEAA